MHIITKTKLIENVRPEGGGSVRCWKCGNTMDKDPDTRIAQCPYCGRTVVYRTKADKNFYRNYVSSSYSSGSSFSISSCLIVIGAVAIIIIIMPFVLLSVLFGDGFWTVLGSIFSILGNILWTTLSFFFKLLGWIVGGLFELIFS